MADIIGYFPATLAVDINTRTPLRDVEAKVYEISDTAFSNPLAVTDMAGVPLTGNVVVSNSDGIFPEFRVPSGVTQVMLKAGQAITPMTSISLYAEAAVKSAEDAAKFADKAASEAQAGVEAGLASVLAKEDTKQDAQVDWRWALMYAGNREVALGQRSDGSFYPPSLGATSYADSSVVELTADQGWDFAFVYSGNREVAFGRRNDGSYFPDSLGGGSIATPVSVHGDSLTAGWVNYTSELSSLLKRTVTARGNGGMTSYWIAARQGGEPVRITAPATIPASGSVTVQVAYAPRAASDVTGGSNPTFSDLSLDGVLAGVQGTITFNSANMTAVFARAASGRTVPVAAGTPFVTGLTARKSYPIIWTGRNNFKSANDALQVVRDIRAMLAWTENPTKAIIMSIPPWVGEPIGSGIRAQLDSVNLAIRDAFPAYYEDTSSRLRSSSLMEAIGVAPTATDLQNIADGYTPQSLRAVLGDGTPDPGHLGANGYKALNIIIRDIYASRGLLA